MAVLYHQSILPARQTLFWNVHLLLSFQIPVLPSNIDHTFWSVMMDQLWHTSFSKLDWFRNKAQNAKCKTYPGGGISWYLNPMPLKSLIRMLFKGNLSAHTCCYCSDAMCHEDYYFSGISLFQSAVLLMKKSVWWKLAAKNVLLFHGIISVFCQMEATPHSLSINLRHNHAAAQK